MCVCVVTNGPKPNCWFQGKSYPESPGLTHLPPITKWFTSGWTQVIHDVHESSPDSSWNDVHRFFFHPRSERLHAFSLTGSQGLTPRWLPAEPGDRCSGGDRPSRPPGHGDVGLEESQGAELLAEAREPGAPGTYWRVWPGRFWPGRSAARSRVGLLEQRAGPVLWSGVLCPELGQPWVNPAWGPSECVLLLSRLPWTVDPGRIGFTWQTADWFVRVSCVDAET